MDSSVANLIRRYYSQAIFLTVEAEAQGVTTDVSAGARTVPKSDVQANPQYHKGAITFIHSMSGIVYEISSFTKFFLKKQEMNF
jgi:hypothetical protein